MIRDHGYRQMMLPKTNEYLLDVLKYEKPYYEASAIADVENILLERGININFNTSANFNTLPANSFSISPYLWVSIVAGIFLSILPLYLSDVFNTTITNDKYYYYGILLLIRILTILICLPLAKKYNIYKGFWIAISLLFGGWALLFIAVDCWLSGTKKR